MSASLGERAATVAWRLAGMATGAAVTVGLVVWGMDLARGDAPTHALPAPVYVEETGGVDHVYDGEFEFFVGGGVAVFDCDGDDRPDLYLAGGSNPARLYRNVSEPGGELRFQPLEAAPATVTDVTGAYPLDVDSDGLTDLAVLRVGPNLLLRGRGDCRFDPANHRWDVEGGDDWTVAFSATWEEGEDFPTLAFANYLRSARDRTCADHRLFRPAGGGYEGPVTLAPGHCALSALFSDWDRSGGRDLRLTNDRHYYTEGGEQLWRMEPGHPPRLYGPEDGWQQMRIWGMGIASHDLTGDGKPEVYLTSQGDNKLQTLTPGADGPHYQDIALPRGANAHRPFVGDTTRPSTAWHAEFDDVNNDGFMDLFVTKGNVEAMEGFAVEDPNNLLLGRPDGTFVEGADQAGLLDLARSRGGAVTDLNRDGLLDVVVVDRRQPVRIWRNTSPEAGNWLQVGLEMEGPNRSGVGSWVQVRVGSHLIEREVTVGGGHAGGEWGPLHFGLGHADRAEVRVEWPDGTRGDWHTFDANQSVTVAR